MARITIYKNSVLATIVSFLGYFGIAMGAVGLVDGEILVGMVCMLIGIGLMVVAGWISSYKAFRKWWKQVEKQGLIPEIQKSAETAVAVYRKNPEKRTLDKIRGLNPQAAAYIEGGCKGPVPQMVVQQPVVVQKPVQQPVQQQPVYQQPVYQQPVYQQPVYQQPVYQQPVYNTSGSGIKTLDEQIDEICRLANANLDTQNDPQIYWECAQKLEKLLQTYPDNERLQRNIAQNLAHYSWHSTAKPFAERRKVYNAALRSLTLGKKKPETAEMDKRKFCLIWHAVNGGLDAVKLDDIDAMEESLQWLRTAATYKMEVPSAERQQYQNVAIPSAHFYVGYWLTKAYLAQTPPQKQRAKAVAEETLQACSYALIRTCDVNPKRNTDTNVLMTREQLMSLLQLASQ